MTSIKTTFIQCNTLAQSIKTIFIFQCGNILPCEVNHMENRRGNKGGMKIDAKMMVKKKAASEKI